MWFKQISLLGFALVLGLMINAFAASSTAPEFRLGVVDFQSALNGVEEGKAAKAKLQKEADERKKDLENRRAKLDKLQGQLADLQKQAQSNIVKPEVMEKGRKLETDFRKQLEEYQGLLEKNQREMQGKESSATAEILNKMKVVVDDIGRAGGYTMIVEKNQSGLLYAASYTDLTEQAIQKYNAAHKKGTKESKK